MQHVPYYIQAQEVRTVIIVVACKTDGTTIIAEIRQVYNAESGRVKTG
jgi:hypothetical protein